MRLLAIIAVLLLPTVSTPFTACAQSASPMPVHAQCDTVIVKQANTDGEVFDWIALLQALVPLSALGIAWYGLLVSKKQVTLPIRVVVMQRQIELVEQAAQVFLQLGLGYQKLARSVRTKDSDLLSSGMETTSAALSELAMLHPRLELVTPRVVFEAFGRTLQKGRDVHQAFNPETLSHKNPHELQKGVDELTLSIKEFTNMCRDEFRLERISKGTVDLVDSDNRA